MHIDIRDHGARPDALNTQAIQSAIDAASPTGGRVSIPPGTWHSGTVHLRSGVELHLTAGAVLKGTNNPADYPAWTPEPSVVRSRRCLPRRMVLAFQCEDVAVTGPGCIDGDGGCLGKITEGGNEARPTNLQFIASSRVSVQDVRLRRAGSWMQQYLACQEVRIQGIRVWNHDNRTNDGLDIDGCQDVLVHGCDIDSRDDALVFKSTGPSPCRNIVVTGCRLRSNCHPIKFGTESVGGFENIRVANCILSPSRHPEPMPGYPEGRPLITACALECVDGGTMRQISLEGILAERVLAPVLVKLGKRLDRRLGEDAPPEGTLEDISIRDLHVTQAGPYCSSITGYPGNPVRRVRLAGLRVNHTGGASAEAILPDVPENETGYPEITMFGNKKGMHLPAWGLFARHVEDLTLEDVDLRRTGPDAREPIVTDDVTGLTMHRVRTPES